MTQPNPVAPHADSAAAPAETWHDVLDAHAEVHGFHVRLSPTHGAVFTEEDARVLLVTFEEAGTIRAREPALPYGLQIAGRHDWSQLCFYAEGDTWFRDPEVYGFVDDLVDDGFFEHFDRVVFYGVGACGYAAAAFSVAAPGAHVLAIRPQATLDPQIAGWDTRHRAARRSDFRHRYGHAPSLIDAAEQVFLIHDPQTALDAMHVALLTGPNVIRLDTPFLGPRPEDELTEMEVLDQLIIALGQGKLDAQTYHELLRRRQRHLPYLRRLLDHLRANERWDLVHRLCRAVLRFADRARFRQGLDEASKKRRKR